MKTYKRTQKFNLEKKLYQVLYYYFINNEIDIYEKKWSNLSKNVIRKLIKEDAVFVNSIQIIEINYLIGDNAIISIPSFDIEFTCIENSNYIDDNPIENKEITENDLTESIQLVDEENEVDKFVINFLKENLDCSSLEELKSMDSKKALCNLIKLYTIKEFEEIKNSKFSYEITNYIKLIIKETKILTELDAQKHHLKFDGELVDLLLKGKLKKEEQLNSINEDLINGLYSNSIFKYLREYRTIYNSDTFQYLINPLLNNKISSPIAIEDLLKVVKKAENLNTVEEKCNHFEFYLNQFKIYSDELKNSNSYNNTFFKRISEYLAELVEKYCEIEKEKNALIEIEPTNRKYNFSNLERNEQEIYFIISNNGEGIAKNVIIKSNSKYFDFKPLEVGILKPNEKRVVFTISTINFDDDFKSVLDLNYSWEEFSGQNKIHNKMIEFKTQKTDVPWDKLKKQSPYSFSIIDNIENLYGREEILDELKSNILSNNIDSYKLWGQKRVGKSSIVKTLKSIIDEEEKIIVIFKSMGGVRALDPNDTLNNLLESLSTEIYEEIDKKIRNPAIREMLRNISIPSFKGSFHPLQKYIENLRKIDTELKFIFILDEFDRINQEFFLPGELGDILSLGIGKGLNEFNYIGFILVGSENMHLLNRQGMNYNSYQEKEVDTFNKEKEFNSFVKIITGPTSPYINYSDEAVELIFNESNGNPYFANLICANIFKYIYDDKDSDVNSRTVDKAILTIINSSQKSHFEHYWSDGITEQSLIKRDRKADIRRRVLVGFSMAFNLLDKNYPLKSDIIKNFKPPIESEYIIEKYEVENTIKEFYNRKIFIEKSSKQIRILPKLFESWLCGTGKSLMIEGVYDLEALQREIDLEKELELKQEELNRLSENFIFKEKKIKPEVFGNYFKQFGNSSQQRRIFKLVDAIYYISKEDILSFYRNEKWNIFNRKNETFLKEGAKVVFRENVELYTFSNYFEENKSIVETFKLINHIRQQKILRTIKSDHLSWKKNDAKEIIIIEPVIDNFSDIKEELLLLLNEITQKENIDVKLITFLITSKAKVDLINSTTSFNNFKSLHLREVEESRIKPFITGTEIFENDIEANQAFYEVRNQNQNTLRDELLVLVEDLCPSKSCSILWQKGSHFKPIFLNEFGKKNEFNSHKEEDKEEDKEDRRTRVYHANRELSQSLNRFIIDYLKEKSKKDNREDWFIELYIPKSVLKSIGAKWTDEGCLNPKETYFDFLDYQKIIEKNKELIVVFNIKGKGLDWCQTLNVLRRDPAHPEKHAPIEKDVKEFEEIKDKIIQNIKDFQQKSNNLEAISK